MVEVFKTDVSHREAAALLVSHLKKMQPGWRVNFDLSDCDRILRIEYSSGPFNSGSVMELLKDFGFHAELLPDEVVANKPGG